MDIRLGESIRSLRKKSGFTQEQLAEALGVSVSAVHKWESGKATPELQMLVDIAEFFETSVDAILNYGWEKLSMGKASEKILQYSQDKNFSEGIRFSEKALQKYPNSFNIVYRSAEIYFLTLNPKNMPRAMELYKRAIDLLEQNTNVEINAITIENRVASCLCYLDRTEEAISIFKKNNADGLNSYRIGLLLSQEKEKSDEALKYLSDALGDCYSRIFNTVIGYANVFHAKNDPEKLYEIVYWLYELGNGLRDPGVVNWIDRGNISLFTILAECEYMRGNPHGVFEWLSKAKESADKFDAAPNYKTGDGMKFHYGNKNAVSYDDMGETGIAMIEKIMEDDAQIGPHLRPFWNQLLDDHKECS